EPFHAVGLWYEDFEQTSDEEVRELLERAQEERRAPRAQGVREVRVDVPAGDRVALEGDLALPEGAIGVILFAHGSGSSRHSPRTAGGARRRLARRAPGPRRRRARRGPRSYAADRRRQRQTRDRDELRGLSPAADGEGAADHSRRYPLVRGARRARTCRAARGS